MFVCFCWEPMFLFSLEISKQVLEKQMVVTWCVFRRKSKYVFENAIPHALCWNIWVVTKWLCQYSWCSYHCNMGMCFLGLSLSSTGLLAPGISTFSKLNVCLLCVWNLSPNVSSSNPTLFLKIWKCFSRVV